MWKANVVYCYVCAACVCYGLWCTAGWGWIIQCWEPATNCSESQWDRHWRTDWRTPISQLCGCLTIESHLLKHSNLKLCTQNTLAPFNLLQIELFSVFMKYYIMVLGRVVLCLWAHFERGILPPSVIVENTKKLQYVVNFRLRITSAAKLLFSVIIIFVTLGHKTKVAWVYV